MTLDLSALRTLCCESPRDAVWAFRASATAVTSVTPAVVLALIARLEQAEAENEDLHLVAQGVKHYWRCEPDLLCVRCRAEQAERERDEAFQIAKAAVTANDEWRAQSQRNGELARAVITAFEKSVEEMRQRLLRGGLR